MRRYARRPWLAFPLAVALLLLLLGLLASGLSGSQTRARRTVEERFADEARTRAELTRAIFRSSADTVRAIGTRRYASTRVSGATLSAVARQGHSVDVVLVARGGSTIAASAGTPASVIREIRARPRFVREALAGAPFALSGVMALTPGRAVVQLAQGVDTAHGRRVLVSGFAPQALSGFIGGYLVGSTDTPSRRAYVVDDGGTIVASASRATPAAAITGEPRLVRTAEPGTRGEFGAGRFFVASGIPNSRWRIVLTEASSSLFASVSGASKWVPWILFAAFALVSIIALALVSRILRAAATQRRIDARLRAAVDERLQMAAIVESSDDAIIGQTLGGTIISWNRGAERLYGYAHDEVVGQPVTILIPPQRLRELSAAMQRIDCDRVDHRETVRLDRAGREISVALTMSPVYNAGGELTGASTIARDIGARKRIEADLVIARDEALEASRGKSEFVANMSHEIRTPLNGVVGMTELLRDTPLDPVQREYADALASSSEALLAVINDILDFSKMEAGRMELDPSDFELRGAVEEACLMLAKQAHAKELEISHWVEADVPVAVAGDRARLRQILLNLLANAVKFTASGEVVVHVSRDARDTIHFAVSDTGVGIEAERAEDLFEAFVQGDQSTTREYGGTGLGLAIARQLAERMGGTIGAEPREEGGSVFWFTAELPAREGPLAEVQPRPELLGRRVLVVDNNATNRSILERYLSAWGLVCEGVGAPEDAIRAFEHASQSGEPFDLALLDFKMPGMNGVELAKEIRRRAGPRPPRIVMLSSALVDRTTLAPAGVFALLSKPARQADLYRTILDAVSGVVPTGESTAAGSPSAAPEGPLVLIAEDNEVNYAVAKALLAKRGLRTELAQNGREALEMARTGGYAAILMDCQMPELDGYEATRRIRAAEDDGQHVPIIAMTAHSMRGDRDRCLAAGMDDYLSKPVRNAELDAAIGRWLPGYDRGDRDREHDRDHVDVDVAVGECVGNGNGNGSAMSNDEDAGVASRRSAASGAGGAGGVSGAVAGAPSGGEPGARSAARTGVAAAAVQVEDVLDEAIVAQLKHALTPAMCDHLVGTFEESLPRCLADIQAAVASGDTVWLRRASHLLKGSSATLGARRLRDFCLRLEQTREDDAPVGAEQMEQLRVVAEQAREALRARLA